ncbi:hypothetical protein BB560_002125 [Smittium megazygosporum]|nr:hypothetical protein BB560_002125 [Smittium megazygosporum]
MFFQTFRVKKKVFKIYSQDPNHRKIVLGIYRDLLRKSAKFQDNVISTFLKNWIRERFRFNSTFNNKAVLQSAINLALKTQISLRNALSSSQKDLVFISDLAYGRQGRLKYIIDRIKTYNNPRKLCRFIKDTRPADSIQKYPQSYYAIPFDQRIFQIPEQLLNVSPRPKLHLGRSLDAKGSPFRKFLVTSSSGIKFYRYKGITQPHWISTLIKNLSLQKALYTEKMQYYQDAYFHMKQEEKFLEKLGVSDTGYCESIKSTIDIYSKRINHISNYSIGKK